MGQSRGVDPWGGPIAYRLFSCVLLSGLAVLQSERQVRLLAKVLNDEIDLIVSHDRLLLLPLCYPTDVCRRLS